MKFRCFVISGHTTSMKERPRLSIGAAAIILEFQVEIARASTNTASIPIQMTAWPKETQFPKQQRRINLTSWSKTRIMLTTKS